MGNDVKVEAKEDVAETPENPVETSENAQEPASEPVLSDDEIQPHPDLLIGGEPSVSEEPEADTPNSEDENNSEG